MEYIEREAAIQAASIWNGDVPTEEWVKSALRKLPAADVRPVVKSEWYGEADGYADGELVYDMWSYPVCGKWFEEWEEKPDWNFCPNCGADMRAES